MKARKTAYLEWQFVLGQGISSRLIAWFGQGYGGWSHVDFLMPDGSCLGARSDVVTAEGKAYPAGVEIRPAGYETWKRRSVMRLACTERQASHARSFLRKQIGCGYDKADIWGFILGREMKTEGEWVCSAVQLEMMETVGLIPRMHVTPQQCPPNMLFSVINAIGGVLRDDKAK